MTTKTENITTPMNQAIEIANRYQYFGRQLFNLTMSQAFIATEATHFNTKELLSSSNFKKGNQAIDLT